MRHNSEIIHTTNSFNHFPHLTMLVKSIASEVSTKPKLSSLTTTLENHRRQQYRSQRLLTTHQNGIQQRLKPFRKFWETASLLISHSLTSTFDKKVAVSVTNTMDSPLTIGKNTQFAELTPDFFP